MQIQLKQRNEIIVVHFFPCVEVFSVVNEHPRYTAIIMSGRPVNLNAILLDCLDTLRVNQCSVHMMSPVADNCPSRIRRRERKYLMKNSNERMVSDQRIEPATSWMPAGHDSDWAIWHWGEIKQILWLHDALPVRWRKDNNNNNRLYL